MKEEELLDTLLFIVERENIEELLVILRHHFTNITRETYDENNTHGWDTRRVGNEEEHKHRRCAIASWFEAPAGKSVSSWDSVRRVESLLEILNLIGECECLSGGMQSYQRWFSKK